MTKATVNGIECTIYDYQLNVYGHMFALVKYPDIPNKVWTPASLIEVKIGE